MHGTLTREAVHTIIIIKHCWLRVSTMSQTNVAYIVQQPGHVGQTRASKVKEPGVQSSTYYPQYIPVKSLHNSASPVPSTPRGPTFDCLVSMRKQSPFSPAAAKSLAVLGSARVQYKSCEDLPTCIPKIAKCGIQPATKKKDTKVRNLEKKYICTWNKWEMQAA